MQELNILSEGRLEQCNFQRVIHAGPPDDKFAACKGFRTDAANLPSQRKKSDTASLRGMIGRNALGANRQAPRLRGQSEKMLPLDGVGLVGKKDTTGGNLFGDCFACLSSFFALVGGARQLRLPGRLPTSFLLLSKSPKVSLLLDLISARSL